MKRASLSALPARPQPEPADLTDRLLDREAGPPAAPAEAPTPKRARAPRRKAAATTAAPAPAEPTEPDIDQALQQAEGAAQALRLAARSAPARYELALRYRLDALAHHIQQVAEFIHGRTQR